MPVIRPFDGYLVDPSHAQAVVTPAYDAMTPQERRTFAESNPGNYVNVMRTLDDFSSDDDPRTLDEVLEHNQKRLDMLFRNGAFNRIAEPGYYLYRLQVEDHDQVGLVADIPVADYVNGRLRKHENTLIEKENMLTRYNETVGVTSSPVCIAYLPREGVSAAVAETMSGPPELQLSAWDDVEQTVWRVSDPDVARSLEREFAEIEVTYLTDGHHRCASGVRYANSMNEKQPDATADATHNRLLVAMFPANQLRIFPFFRCVSDLNGLSQEQLIESIEQSGFAVSRLDSEDEKDLLPSRARRMTMFIDGAAFAIEISRRHVPENDPVEALDVSILQERILKPVLGIQDATADKRLSYLPGVAGVSGLRDRFRNDGWRLGFACFSTSFQEMKDVADVDGVMPPKSTWFDPKMRAGLFLRKC